MTNGVRIRLAIAILVISSAVAPRDTAAQSVGQSAAWGALTLSPIGGLSPLARIPGALAGGSSDISLRYGRWRYDPDDAVHDTFGVTWAHRLGVANATIEITGAYALVECPTCSGSVLGGIDVQSTLLQHGATAATGNPVRTALGVRLSFGAARTLGSDPSTSGSTAITLPMDLALPLGGTWSFTTSIQPGVGYGHIASTDFGAGGVLPMVGAAVALHAGSRLALHVGTERVFIDGGPTQVGASLSWRLR